MEGPWLTIGPCEGGTAWTPGLHGPSTSLRFLLLEKCLKRATETTIFRKHLRRRVAATLPGPHHFFFSYLSCRNSLNFCESFMSGQPSVLGSNAHSHVLLPTWTRTQKRGNRKSDTQTIEARTGLSRRIPNSCFGKATGADAVRKTRAGDSHPEITASESQLEAF